MRFQGSFSYYSVPYPFLNNATLLKNVFCLALLVQIINFATNSNNFIFKSLLNFVRNYRYNLGSVLNLSFALTLLGSMLSDVGSIHELSPTAKNKKRQKPTPQPRKTKQTKTSVLSHLLKRIKKIF